MRVLHSATRVGHGVRLMRAVLFFAILFSGVGQKSLHAHTETDVAIAEFTALIALAPSNDELLVRRGMCHEEHRDWAAAEQDFRRANELAPTARRPAIGLARVFLATERATLAVARMDVLLAREPRDAEALVLRARAQKTIGQIERAYADYSAAIDALENPRPEIFLERAALTIGNDRALMSIEEGLTRVGPVIGLLERAIELELNLGRVDGALRRIEAVAAQAERKETWLRRSGDVLVAAGRAAEAQTAYRAALAAVESLPVWLRESPETVRFAAELNALVKRSS